MLNDLLDPARTNLKLREDARRGAPIQVDGIHEETLVSAEHALHVIAMGSEQRKVGGGWGGGVGGGGGRLAGGRGGTKQALGRGLCGVVWPCLGLLGGAGQ